MPSIKHLYAILRHHLRNCLNFSPKKSLMQNTIDASVHHQSMKHLRNALTVLILGSDEGFWGASVPQMGKNRPDGSV